MKLYKSLVVCFCQRESIEIKQNNVCVLYIKYKEQNLRLYTESNKQNARSGRGIEIHVVLKRSKKNVKY